MIQSENSSLIADTLAKYLLVGSQATTPYSDANKNEEQSDDGILTSILTGPIINHLVQTVFNVIELKLNILVTLRRIFSYDNIRAGLLRFRQFLNLVLRLCLLINRFLPEAELDTNGLSALLSYYPTNLPDRYGIPSETHNNASFVSLTTSTSSEAHVLQQPSTEVPTKPASTYGLPANPINDYGISDESNNFLGIPDEEHNKDNQHSVYTVNDLKLFAEETSNLISKNKELYNSFTAKVEQVSPASNEYGVPLKNQQSNFRPVTADEEYGISPNEYKQFEDDNEQFAQSYYYQDKK